jgi:Domain of unknown function (DUF4349)
VSPLELVDDRFEKLATELRAARPVVPAELRERVRTLAPPPRRGLELPSLRRVVPAVALAALAAALAVAGVAGLVHGSSSRRAATIAPAPPGAAIGDKALQNAQPLRLQSRGSRAVHWGGAFAPSANRLQQYDAFLRVRVASQDDLSARTQQALRLTRGLGGYVVSANYSAPGTTGTSILALRIPIEHVQTAIARFSGYGTLVSQRIVLKDLQRRVDTLSARIHKLRAEIAAGRLSQAQLDRDRALLKALTSRRSAAVQRAQLASVALTLTVAAKHKHAAAPPGRFHRTLSGAADVLVRELEILVYVLLVTGPLLLLGGLAILGGRTLRRRADRRLLKRA